MTFEMYKDTAEEFRWRLKANNGQVVAVSGEGYKNRSDCAGIIGKIRTESGTANILDVTAA
jgi:uncharacterized protein YegP (UPF0339 family)